MDWGKGITRLLIHIKKPAPNRELACVIVSGISRICRNLCNKVLNHHSSKWVFAETFLSSTTIGGLTFQFRYKTPYYSIKVKTYYHYVQCSLCLYNTEKDSLNQGQLFPSLLK